ncbi:15519_t:CDS:2, partial [Acaulospora colombiana]
MNFLKHNHHFLGKFFNNNNRSPDEVKRCFRYGSSSQVRDNVHVKWYIDGKNYFYAVSEALMAAKAEILIEGWWLSPELYLRRPPCMNGEYRLDRILKKKAEEGVKIYIVLYNESKYLSLNSRHSEEVLQGLHQNILVTATKEIDSHTVKNLIGKAIVERIARAHANDEKFRIIVSLPLIPAFPVALDDSDSAIIRYNNLRYQSICRGKHSIIEQIKKAGCATPERYIGFYALRSYGKIDYSAIQRGLGVLEDELIAPNLFDESDLAGDYENDPTGAYVTEEILIHSSLLIADDRTVIIGSANLNDRSLNGDHDSEIAAIIEDKDYIESKMADTR